MVRFQGPRANGMPELHKLTPPLAVLQGKGFQRRAGHRRPHVRRLGQGAGGDPRHARRRWPAARSAQLRDGDIVRLDAAAGTLRGAGRRRANGRAREAAAHADAQRDANGHGLGRELFAGMRRNALSAEEGACTWL